MQSNLTYLDCPVAYAADKTKEEFSMAVAVHNPSSSHKHSFKMLVPRGQYKVERIDSDEITAMNSSVHCHLDLGDNLEQVDSCSLEIHSIHLAPKTVSLFQVTRVSAELVDSIEQNDEIKIANTETIVKFVDLDSQNGILRFNVLNEKLAMNETVDMTLKYWEGKASFNNWNNVNVQNSGAYIFIPATGQFEALPYTSLIKRTKLSDDTFVFNLGQVNDENQMYKEANVTVRAHMCQQNKIFFKVEVDLFGLPSMPYGGHEVVVEFSSPGLDNQETFYTDANGLDMQKRILNYRPTWNVSDNYDGSNVNITANFYPVNSAIQIRDAAQKKTLTVMNDRSQAGTSLEKGKI